MVTSEMATRQQMRLDSAGMRALLDLAPDGIFAADVEGRYTYVNAAGSAMLGYEREEIIGMTIFDLISHDDVERLAKSKAAMLRGSVDADEWMLRRKDGSWLAVEVHANILPDGQWQGFVRDISSRKAQMAEREALFDQVERERRRLQAVMDTLPLGLLIFEADGAVSANQRAQHLFGKRPGQAESGYPYSHLFFYPDGRAVPAEALVSARALRQGRTILGEDYVVRREDGTEIPVLASAAPILDSDGSVAGAIGVFQDISDRMGLERAVRDDERLLKAVFDILPVGVWISDPTGRLVRNNPAGEGIWHGVRHVPVEQYGEYKGWRVGSGEPIAAHEWAMAKAVDTGEISAGELVRIQCFDGSFKTIINSAAPLRDEQGHIIGAIGVNEDITALYEAQEKQRASERLFRTVFDLLPVGLWVADGKGNILLGNRAGADIWQGIRHVSPEQYGEYEAWWVDTGSPIAADEWGIARAIKRGETSRRELIRIKCFDGSFKTIINWAAPIRSDSGDITGAVAVNEDVTALYQTQEQLRAAVRDREHILAVVAHDLRNPLSGISLRAALAEQKALSVAGGDDLRGIAVSIGQIAHRMSGLVDDLLAVSTTRLGRSMLASLPVAPGVILANAAEAARMPYAQAGLRLVVEAAPDLSPVHVDLNRILRVFANLLDNALKFTERGGHVELRAAAAGGAVLFTVANSGPPLAQEQMERLFLPFWQAGREDRRGAGLGLSICRSIVEAHGGSVWSEAAEGMRVKICLLLPCVKPVTPGTGAAPLGLAGGPPNEAPPGHGGALSSPGT